MPNNIGTSPGLMIARRALDTLIEEFPLLRLISADFSDEQALWGQSVKIQIPNAFDGADEYSTSTGYEAQSVSQDEFPLTINKHVHVTYGFNDQERTSHSFHLIERFARNAAHAIGKSFMDDLCGLVIADNFEHGIDMHVAAWDTDDLFDVRKRFNARKLPKSGRVALYSSDYYKQIASQAVVSANPGSPSETIRDGEIGDVAGFRVLEYAHLPANDHGLGGFHCTPEGLILATRVPVEPDRDALAGSIESVREPNTGLTLQVRQWYDFKLGKEFRTYTLMYGVAAGNPECLERVYHTAPAE